MIRGYYSATKNELKWLAKDLRRNKKIKIIKISEIEPTEHSTKYRQMRVEFEKLTSAQRKHRHLQANTPKDRQESIKIFTDAEADHIRHIKEVHDKVAHYIDKRHAEEKCHEDELHSQEGSFGADKNNGQAS